MNWKRRRLGDVISVKHGFAFPGDGFSDDLNFPTPLTPGNFAIGGGFQEAKPKTFTGTVPPEYVVRPGSLVVSMTDLSRAGDTLGYSATVPADRTYLHNQRIGLVEVLDPDEVNQAFVGWVLRTHEYRGFVLGSHTGSTVKHTSPRTILSYETLFPPLEEQERIAGVLGAFDDLIETNRRLADHLDDLRRTKVSHALAASSDTTRLSEAASFVNGRNFTKGADGAGRPVIRTPEVRSGPGGNTVWSSVVADDDRVARAGDILFVWSGTLMVNRWLYADGLVNQHVFKVIPKGVPDWYVYALIEAQLPWFLGLAKDKATTMGHIQRAHLDEPMTGLDPDAVARLGAVIEPIWSAALELRLEAQDLARQRDELLPLLMSGRVRVRDLEAVA